MFQRTVRPIARLAVPSVLLAAALPCLLGCNRNKNADADAAPPKPKPAPTVSEVDLKAYKPNEAGAVMVVMYHRFDPKKPSSAKDYNRAPDDFRKDLNDLYTKGYRPVTVSEFVENRMDVPAGKTPVVLTFDDSVPTQFKLLSGTAIDPDCAVGIMETFHKAHPDWPTKGTFFVLPEATKRGARTPAPFGDPNTSAEKLDYLMKNGYEIQNHSSTHPRFSSLSADKIQEEIGYATHNIRQLNPKAAMDVLAMPYGTLPRKGLEQYLHAGKWDGTTYQIKAVVRAAWRPVASPVTKSGRRNTGNVAAFDIHHIERVTPGPDLPDKPGKFEFWLKWFDENPAERYVSDGNPQVVAVPASLKSLVDAEAVKRQGKILQLYKTSGNSAGLSVESGAASSSGGSGLSVEPSNVGPKHR